VFVNNRLSLQLISDKPMHSAVELLYFKIRPSFQLFLTYRRTDENSHSVMSLAEAMTDPEWAHSYAPNQSAFNKWTGYSQTIFDWFEVLSLCVVYNLYIHSTEASIENARRSSSVCSIRCQYARLEPGYRCIICRKVCVSSSPVV
jgi:hypothetical protein